MKVVGSGPLADELRLRLGDDHPDATVIVPDLDTEPRAAIDLTDEDFDRGFEQPMRAAISAVIDAHRAGHSRVVLVVPTTSMSGGAGYLAAAAAAEAMRVMVKSAARQWGAVGMRVNAVAVHPSRFGFDTARAGAVAIAPPALAAADPVPAIGFLCSPANDATGTTLVVDGGEWMSP